MADLPTFINDEWQNTLMLSSEFRMLNAFLHNPSKELYARQIERLTKTNHERAGVYLGKLVGDYNVLVREQKGKQVFYRLNKGNETTQKAMAMLELERKISFLGKNEAGFAVQELVSEIINGFGPAVYFAVLFGSAARGQAKENSDVDLLFVLLRNGKTKSRIGEMVKKRVTITGKNFSYHPVALSELKTRWLSEPVYKNIWDERVVFFGEENFWSFVLKEGEPRG